MVLSLWLMACLPKHTAVVAPHPVATDLIVVQDQLESRSVREGPSTLVVGIEEVLKDHALIASVVDAELWKDAFMGRKTEAQRLAWMAERQPVGSALMLVEARAEFYSQMNGRYRWTVEVEATLKSTTNPDAIANEQFSVPVFLEFDHEREDAALAAAVPVIQHHLDALVESWLGGLNP